MKKHILSNFKGFLILFFLLIFSHLGWSQDKIIQSKPKDWVVMHSTDAYTIYYKYGVCDKPEQGTNREYVLLKVENKLEEDIRIEWDLALYFGKRCINCDGENVEMHANLKVPAKGVLVGDCSDDVPVQNLEIMSRFLNVEDTSILTDFILNNISFKKHNQH